MARPPSWSNVYTSSFYPIGITPAMCLTKDIAPEEPAHILALGCGDPKNILYTITCEPGDRELCVVYDMSIYLRQM